MGTRVDREALRRGWICKPHHSISREFKRCSGHAYSELLLRNAKYVADSYPRNVKERAWLASYRSACMADAKQNLEFNWDFGAYVYSYLLYSLSPDLSPEIEVCGLWD